MYEVKAVNTSEEIYLNIVSTEPDAPRITGTIKQGINVIDSFTFTIYPNHPAYNALHPFSTKITVFNTKTHKYEFVGRVLMTKKRMESSGLISTEVVCESDLGYLNDSITQYGEYHDTSVRDYLQIILDNHNNQVSADKQFQVGIVEVEENLYRYLGYDKTFATIKDKLLDCLGGELRIRYDNGIRYLDYLTEIGEVKTTDIRLAKNLITIEQEQDPSAIISRLIPLGNKLSDDTEERLTISEVNNGINYIDDEEAIAKFGIIVGSQTWDDVSLASNLLTKGKEFQKENNRIKKAHKLSALDLSLIGLDIDSFELGNYHPVINPLMQIDETLRIIEKSIIIESPESSTLTIGDKFLDIKDYQLDAISTAQEVATVKSNVQSVASNVTTLSVELTKTAESLQGANTSIADLTTIVGANIDATNAILVNLNAMNNKLERLTKRINLGV